MVRWRHLVWVLFAAAITMASPAVSQAKPKSPAEKLFREGRKAMKRNDFETACPKFAESLELARKAGTLLNLSLCKEKLGKLTEALAHQRDAITLMKPDDKRHQGAKAREADLDRRVPQLTVKRASAAPASLRIRLNGEEIPDKKIGSPFPLDPGDYTLTVDTKGKRERRYEVSLSVGDRQEVVVAPADSGQKPKPAASKPAVETKPKARESQPREPSGSSRRTWGFILGGVGVAGLAVAGVTGFMLSGKKGVVDDHCDANKVCDAEGIDAADSGKQLVPVYLAGWIVGGLGIASGGYFLLTSPSDEPRTEVRVQAAPGVAGLSVSGVFQ